MINIFFFFVIYDKKASGQPYGLVRQLNFIQSKYFSLRNVFYLFWKQNFHIIITIHKPPKQINAF